MPADEVLIIDDCSTDATFDLLVEYLEEHRLQTWRLRRNATNLGWRESFRRGLSLVKGDLVFLCDQDDIWHADKIALMHREMERNPEILLLASTFNIVSEKARLGLRERMPRAKFPDGVSRVNTLEDFVRVGLPGCAYALRMRLVRDALAIWVDGASHDGMLWRTALVRGGLFVSGSALFEYRRHAGTATGGFPDWESRVGELALLRMIAQRVAGEMGSDSNTWTVSIAQLEKCERWAAARLEFNRKPSWKTLRGAVAACMELSYGWRSVLTDCIYAIRASSSTGAR